jgi:hypothetical protein
MPAFFIGPRQKPMQMSREETVNEQEADHVLQFVRHFDKTQLFVKRKLVE